MVKGKIRVLFLQGGYQNNAKAALSRVSSGSLTQGLGCALTSEKMSLVTLEMIMRYPRERRSTRRPGIKIKG